MRGAWREVVESAAKCSGAALVVAAVGFCVAAFEPSGGVAPSHADIVGYFSGVDGDRAFREALEAMGHEQAHPYTLNGNRIYVSTASLESPPARALRRYQREFVDRGLNERVYTEVTPRLGLGRTRDALTGGLVPAVVGERRVVMRGATGASNSADWRDLMGRASRAEDAGMGGLVEGFRWVELLRPRGESGAKAVAIWSGEEFEYDRMFPGSLEEREHAIPDEVPPCPGCTFVNQFGDPGSDAHRGAYLWTSERQVRSLAQYYRRECRRRGWSVSEASRWVEELARRLDWHRRRRVSCRRGERRLSVNLFPGDRSETAVRVELGRRPAVDRSETAPETSSDRAWFEQTDGESAQRGEP